MPTTSTAPRLVEQVGAYSILLNAAFEQICDPADWRGPVDAMVPWEGVNIYLQAVEYMTATIPTCKHVVMEGKSFGRITSIGYRMGPAGDR